MGYISEKFILKNEEKKEDREKIIYEAKPSWWSHCLPIFIGVILLPFVIGLFILIVTFINIKCTEYVITNKRVISKFGWININVIETKLSKIETIDIKQNFFERFFNFGTINILGTGGSKNSIEYVKFPLEFKKHLDDVIDK